MKLPSIKNLQYLVALSKHLHFSKAAKACFVSQSTLSAGIHKLEQDFQLQLVERNNKSVAFTRMGLEVVKQAQSILLSMQDLVKTAHTDFFESSLVIGIIPTISPYLLPSFLNKIKHHYPRLKLSIVEDTSESLLNKALEMEIDFAIFAFPYEIPKNITHHGLFNDPLCFIHHRNQAAKIQRKQLLLLKQGHCLRSHVLLHQNISEDKISDFSCSSLPTLVAMVNMQMGVSFIPQMAVEQDILKLYPDIQINKSRVQIAREIGIIYRSKVADEPGFLTLAQLLSANN